MSRNCARTRSSEPQSLPRPGLRAEYGRTNSTQTASEETQMAELTGSEILAKCLKAEGVEDLFFIMGGPMLLAESSAINEGIRLIDVRHEQAAAFSAQAYSRLRQKPGVC